MAVTPQTIAIAVVVVVYFLVRYFNRTDVPKIKGLPEIPGVPIFGNLLQLGNKHATVAAKWAKEYGPVFQVRMGNKRVVFANSFDSVRQLWIKDPSALISRPTFHTFHSVVSTSQGFTIGTSPWDESCKRRRKAAATALNRPAVQSYMPIIDLESTASIRELLKDSKGGAVDINPIAYFQRFALNTSLMLNYGFRIEGNVDDALLRDMRCRARRVQLPLHQQQLAGLHPNLALISQDEPRSSRLPRPPRQVPDVLAGHAEGTHCPGHRQAVHHREHSQGSRGQAERGYVCMRIHTG
jgi:phenylacetate 2-hydroxylase